MIRCVHIILWPEEVCKFWMSLSVALVAQGIVMKQIEFWATWNPNREYWNVVIMFSFRWQALERDFVTTSSKCMVTLDRARTGSKLGFAVYGIFPRIFSFRSPHHFDYRVVRKFWGRFFRILQEVIFAIVKDWFLDNFCDVQKVAFLWHKIFGVFYYSTQSSVTR